MIGCSSCHVTSASAKQSESQHALLSFLVSHQSPRGNISQAVNMLLTVPDCVVIVNVQPEETKRLEFGLIRVTELTSERRNVQKTDQIIIHLLTDPVGDYLHPHSNKPLLHPRPDVCHYFGLFFDFLLFKDQVHKPSVENDDI